MNLDVFKGREGEGIGMKREEMIRRCEIGRGEMSGASLVFGKFFDFLFVPFRLQFKPTSTHGSA